MAAADYVSVDTTPLFAGAEGKDALIHLLWGDRVDVIEEQGSRAKVRARGRSRFGWVEKSDLGGESLLELYFIDVGQGDGVLIRTPGGRHVMLDGGYPRAAQDTGKSAADFVDWKFFQDYGATRIELDALLASHNDADHYGGLWDLLDVAQTSELDCSDVRVKAMYHAGIGWWKRPGGGKWLGEHESQDGGRFHTQLVGDRASVERALDGGPSPQFQGWWAQFMQSVLGARWTNGRPTTITRLCDRHAHLPGFEPGRAGEPAIRVLGPVEFDVGGKPGLHRFAGGEAQNTNGNSLLLRLDYKRARVLLTGDLNRRSQDALMADYAGRRQEFLCDVGKACHHGSDDVSIAFLQAMNPAVTVISSGDNEGHDHPRAAIVAASAITGHLELRDDAIVTPLVFCTELARSIRLGDPESLDFEDAAGVAATLSGQRFERAALHYEQTKPGGFPAPGKRSMGATPVVAGLIYGLVNVRTDGERILCATLDEADHTWRIQTVTARF